MLDAIDRWLIPFVESIYAATGYLGLVLVMAAENALFFLPIPSELVLPLAGFVVARDVVEPLTGARWSYPGAVAAAVVGTTLGSLSLYAISYVGGRPLLERYGRYVFIDPADLDRADRWFERYGDVAVFVARMVPVMRSIISIPAGVARMPLWRFTLFSMLGTIPWCMLLVGLGMVLGEHWERVSDLIRPFEYLGYLAVVAVVAFFLWHALRRRGRRPRG